MLSTYTNLINIYYTRFDKELPKDIWDDLIKRIPDDQQVKNGRYRRWQDRHAHLLGKMLMIEGFKNIDGSKDIFQLIQYNEFGRPCLKGRIDFNITHSGNWVMCAIGMDANVGIDVEEIQTIDFNDFTNVMTTDQWQHIRQSDDPTKEFFRYWTIKESVIKADRRGLTIPLLDIHVHSHMVQYDSNNWYLNELHIDDSYCACLTTDQRDPDIQVNYIDFYNLG